MYVSYQFRTQMPLWLDLDISHYSWTFAMFFFLRFTNQEKVETHKTEHKNDDNKKQTIIQPCMFTSCSVNKAGIDLRINK